MKSFFASLVLLFLSWPCIANEIEYRTGGKHFDKVWHAFYVEGDHERELADPLIAAGSAMTMAICEAISHPDMKRRRYAIGALGYLGDKRALPALEKILGSSAEIYYFRGDALQAIYLIDKSLGTRYARQIVNEHDLNIQVVAEHDYLNNLASSILGKEAWLTAPARH
jgi:hypothetical protein